LPPEQVCCPYPLSAEQHSVELPQVAPGLPQHLWPTHPLLPQQSQSSTPQAAPISRQQRLFSVPSV
jgi:hypothetical protein